MIPIHVTAAIIEENGRILLAQRKAGSHLALKWEFPGGKIEKGESLEQCLKRELKEELNVDCEIGDFFCENTYDYGDKLIHLITYRAKIISGVPRAIVHEQIAWVKKEELESYDMPEADVPIVRKIMSK